MIERDRKVTTQLDVLISDSKGAWQQCVTYFARAIACGVTRKIFHDGLHREA